MYEDMSQFSHSLELALKKIPPFDFYTIYSHDLGYVFLGIINGKSIMVELGEDPSVEDVKFLLNIRLKLNIDKKVFEKWAFRYFGE